MKNYGCKLKNNVKLIGANASRILSPEFFANFLFTNCSRISLFVFNSCMYSCSIRVIYSCIIRDFVFVFNSYDYSCAFVIFKMKYPYTLPPLPYPYDALEPYIDRMTMEIHHTKHHQGYINNLNSALEKYPEFHNLELEEILKNLNQLPEEIRTVVRNNGGGHYNHALFWEIMKPASAESALSPDQSVLLENIRNTFGSFEEFKKLFSETALKHFGSGWAWLVLTPDKKLKVYSLPNQDNPLMNGDLPIMGLDVWEHAYYLKYQNRRNEYIEAWWNVVNWEKVEENYNKAIS